MTVMLHRCPPIITVTSSITHGVRRSSPFTVQHDSVQSFTTMKNFNLPLVNAGALRDGNVLLFVCSFVSLSPAKFVKSFARWQHGASVCFRSHLFK